MFCVRDVRSSWGPHVFCCEADIERKQRSTCWTVLCVTARTFSARLRYWIASFMAFEVFPTTFRTGLSRVSSWDIFALAV